MARVRNIKTYTMCTALNIYELLGYGDDLCEFFWRYQIYEILLPLCCLHVSNLIYNFCESCAYIDVRPKVSMKCVGLPGLEVNFWQLGTKRRPIFVYFKILRLENVNRPSKLVGTF